MVKKVDTAIVKLWDKVIGAVSWLDDGAYSIFEFDPKFFNQGLDISPIHMNLEEARRGDGKFSFPSLNKDTFWGLPGLLADALPDKFGNNIIDAWLVRKGRDITNFSPIERLCYIGNRSIGALEFVPATVDKFNTSVAVEISELVELAQRIMQERKALDVNIDNLGSDNANAMLDILRVGTSAGGARPKAVIAMNKHGNVISGQTLIPKDYEYWIIKFDGVNDLELGKPKGYGRIEYAYYLMARTAGINMTECRLLEENGHAHFMTKRFDRINGKKLHLHSLCGIAHYDFNMAGNYSYEQAFSVMRKLRLNKAESIEQYRRMIFNVIACNMDDHTKNISYLMKTDGKWTLSPAYDMTYSHNPTGKWTNQHQMSINGKRDQITKKDFLAVGNYINYSKAEQVINDVLQAVKSWPEFAKEAGVETKIISEISKFHYTKL
jgi:serine/threonine-protein kinase HipA